jgi:hypothetical protein
MKRGLAAAIAAVVLAIGGGVAWAGTPDEPAPAAPIVKIDPKPADLRFYEPLRPSVAAALTRPPGTPAEALGDSTATVLATVAGVEAGRSVGEQQYLDVELNVTRVLRGALRPELSTVRVEFPAVFAPEPIAPLIAKLRAVRPADPAVWLLRWEGAPPPTTKPGARRPDPTADLTRYRIIHSTCGVFVQGAAGVVAATARGGDPVIGAQKEVQRLPDLEALIAEVRHR